MYVKLFASLYQGTLRGNSHGILVFTNLLAHADKDGCVDVHPRAIAEEVGLPVEAVRETLLMLESPDDESRSPAEQGRRIVRMDEHRAWGWRIVNYAKYRAIRNEEDRREQNRLAQEKWRAKSKPPSAEPKQDKPRKPPLAQAEAEAYANTEKGAHTEAAAVDNSVRSLEGFKPTKAGAMCKAMRAAGLSATNPGDPRLLALIEQGATEEEFAGIAAEAAAGGKGWAWVLKVLQARRADAAALVLAPKEPEKHWTETSTGIIAKGKELGLGEPNPLEQFPVYRARVMKAAGATQA